MPIVVRRDSGRGLTDLAGIAGTAIGQAERFKRQQAYDQDFIQQAIRASNSRNAQPGYFERESEGAAAESRYNTAIQQNQWAREDANARHDAEFNAKLAIEQQEANTGEFSALAKFQKDQASAKANAELQAFRRSQFKAAAAQGPEALAAYLAEEEATAGRSVPVGYLEQMGTSKGQGPDKRKHVSQFQADAEASIRAGSMGGILAWSGEREAPSPYGGSGPEQPGPLTEKAMQTIAALTHETGVMDLGQLKALRQQIAEGQVTPETKSAAMTVVDKALQQRQKMRDVEISQVFDTVISKATQAVMKSVPGAPALEHKDLRKAVGREALDQCKKFGITPQEFMDWQGRYLSNPHMP